MKRRTFLAVSATAAAFPALAGDRPVTFGSGNPNGIARVVFDDRFGECRQFGQALQGLGCTASSFSGDVTDLWSGLLDREWRDSATVIAGQTTGRCFFCLARMAAGHGVYPKFRIEHTQVPGGGVLHEIHGSEDAVDRAGKELAGTDNWIAATAGLLDFISREGLHVNAARPEHTQITGPGLPVSGHRPGSLVSWVMGPTRKTRLNKQSTRI